MLDYVKKIGIKVPDLIQGWLSGLERVKTETKEDTNKQYYLDLAAALLMGRFKDGTPLMFSNKELGMYKDIPFDYSSDPEGGVCPYQAHIRKVNPRADGPGGARIVRRGAYYENPDEKGGGILFVSLQKSITDQLMPILRRMGMDNRLDPIAYGGTKNDFPFRVPGKVIANNSYRRELERLMVRNRLVNYKGGDFFYLPSLTAIDEYRARTKISTDKFA